jgi:hypothetical protein
VSSAAKAIVDDSPAPRATTSDRPSGVLAAERHLADGRPAITVPRLDRCHLGETLDGLVDVVGRLAAGRGGDQRVQRSSLPAAGTTTGLTEMSGASTVPFRSAARCHSLEVESSQGASERFEARWHRRGGEVEWCSWTTRTLR